MKVIVRESAIQVYRSFVTRVITKVSIQNLFRNDKVHIHKPAVCVCACVCVCVYVCVCEHVYVSLCVK